MDIPVHQVTTSARRVTRRRLLALARGAAAAAAVAAHPAQLKAQQLPAAAMPAGTPPGQRLTSTGQAVPELVSFDRVMSELMTKWQLPGGQLALAKDGRLVLNRGYGLANRERGEPVQPTTLFRIASVSKAITTVAILTLVDAGKLSLDDKVFPLLAFARPAHAPIDPRLNRIIVKDLLVHAGGWESDKSFDPQALPWSRMAAATLGEADPPEAATIVRFMCGMPLDFDPGAKSAYSNFGFNVLGRVVEKITGQSYGNYVQARVLNPAGVTDMRLGRTRLEDRALNEVRYYGPPDQAPNVSVFWGEGFVPFAYGGFYVEAFDSHGGWIASAADLARFTTAIDGQRGAALLKPATVQAMITTPRPPSGATGAGNAPTSTGLGWDMTRMTGGVEWSHAGALIGSSSAMLVRSPDGLTFAFVFNSQPDDTDPFFIEAYNGLKAVASTVRTWPTHDLFATQAVGAPRPVMPTIA